MKANIKVSIENPELFHKYCQSIVSNHLFLGDSDDIMGSISFKMQNGKIKTKVGLKHNPEDYNKIGLRLEVE